MKIKYKEKIRLNRSEDAIYLTTDKSDRYEVIKLNNHHNLWSEWWNMQDQSELRLWQKDIVRTLSTCLGDVTPYLIYKKSHGHNQPHDVFLAHSQTQKLWFLITEHDYWMQQSDYGLIIFDTIDSLGSVLDQDTRKIIYNHYDNMYNMQFGLKSH